MSKEETCVESTVEAEVVVQTATGSPTVVNIGEWRADSEPITFEESKERVDKGDTVFSFAIDSSSYPPRLAVTFVFSISTGFLNRVSLFDQLFIKDPTCFEEYQRLYCFLTVEEPSLCTLDVEHTFKRPDNRHWYVADTRMLSRIIFHLKEFTIGSIRENKEQ